MMPPYQTFDSNPATKITNFFIYLPIVLKSIFYTNKVLLKNTYPWFKNFKQKFSFGDIKILYTYKGMYKK